MSTTTAQVPTKLGLGTVQWGLPYGVANQTGRTGADEVSRILLAARSHGIDLLDTAPLYGEAESVLGQSGVAEFAVVTKTTRFDQPNIGQAEAKALAETFARSMRMLRLDRIYGLLVHNADDLIAPGGEHLVEALQRLRQSGAVQKIGVSVYDGRQIDRILELFAPDLVQLPISVLDQRLLLSGHLAALKGAGVEIHARSVFLQGLLVMKEEDVPRYFAPVVPLLAEWRARTQSSGQLPTQAALAFVRDLPEIDRVVVGVENLVQFETIVDHMQDPRGTDASGLACSQEEFVNPSKWALPK
jgi:aryl-alcohol dehydrogenase-like predicted oxidoreductase